MRARTLALVALLAGAAPLTVLGACRANGSAAAGDSVARNTSQPVAVGDAMPAYTARTLTGDSIRIGGHGDEPLTLVNVWATWCTSCREEFADLEALQRTYAPKGLRVIAVSVDNGDGARVARFVKHEGATFAVAHDPQGRIEDRYRVVGVPSSYLVGRDGTLLWSHVGALPKDASQIVAKALGS